MAASSVAQSALDVAGGWQHTPRRGTVTVKPDTPNISFVGYHVSINNPLIGASPSEYSTDLGRPTASRWTFDIPDVYLQRGDKVSYWLHIVTADQSYIKTDMTWTVTESACSHTNATNLQCQRSMTVFGKVPVCAGQLIFEEQFNNLDFDIWQHENTGSGGRFSEFNMFVNNRSNSFVREGILHIRPTLTADVYGEDFLYNGVLDLRSSSPVGQKCTDPGNNGCYRRAVGAQIINPVLSAKIQTSQSFTFKYGIVKIRAKMPKGDWLWPAVSLLPKHSVYGEWPKSGQIAVVQSRGNTNLTFGNENLGVQRVEVALEYGPEKSADIFKNSIRTHSNSRGNEDWSTDYHDYQLDWRPDGMQFLIDGKSVMNVTPPTGGGFQSLLPSNTDTLLASSIYQDGSKIAPFDQQFYLALSLVVGGVSGYFPDNAVNTPRRKPWNNTSPTPTLDFWEKRDDWWPDWNLHHSEFLIDYIKIWALP